MRHRRSRAVPQTKSCVREDALGTHRLAALEWSPGWAAFERWNKQSPSTNGTSFSERL